MIRVFKASSYASELVMLSGEAIKINHYRGRLTNLLFDTNILISIEMAYLSDDPSIRLAEEGIIELSDLISSHAHFGVFISPAPAYQELPSGRRATVEVAFQRFVDEYLPTFGEDPNATKISFGAGDFNPDAFASLPRRRRELISCAYSSLLAMNVISRINGLSETERFDLYLDFCAEKLNLVSLKELVIARYVFAPDIGLVGDARVRKAAATKNFLKLKKGGDRGLSLSEVLKRIALNGANDLKLVTAADILSNAAEDISGAQITHDVWIATSDEKLYEFCCACPGLVIDGQVGVPARLVDVHDDIRGTRYWRESFDKLARILAKRATALPAEISLGPVVDVALEIEAYVDADRAADYFGSRSWR